MLLSSAPLRLKFCSVLFKFSFCNCFLSDIKCDLIPSRIQRCIGILFHSNTTLFRALVPASSCGGERPRRSRYNGSVGGGNTFPFRFSQNKAVTPKGTIVSLGDCLLTPVTVEPNVQPMTERRAHAVIILLDVHEHWFPWASRKTVPSPVLSTAGSFGYPTARTECAISCTSATECARPR